MNTPPCVVVSRSVAVAIVMGAATLWDPSVASAGEAILVVVNEQSPLTDVNLEELRAIFLGKRRTTSGGAALVPFYLAATHPARRAFDSQALGMTGEQVARYWVDQRIREGTAEPRPVTSAEMMLGIARKMPGAIGYIPATALTAGVRALSINAKAPGDADYPLRLP